MTGIYPRRMPDPSHPPISSLGDPVQPGDLLLYRIAKLSSASARLVTRLCERGHGITRREWGVLMWLAQQPGLQPSALAEKLELDRARISRAIGSMQVKGLIQKTKAQANRREIELHLTEQGQRMHDELWPQIRRINLQLLDALDARDPLAVDRLDAALHSLQGRIQQLEAADGHSDPEFPSRRAGARSRG